MKIKNFIKAIGALFAGALIYSNAYAVPQHLPAADPLGGGYTKWELTFSDDTHPSHPQGVTQTLCLLQTSPQGTNTVGRWVGSFPGWTGAWRQEGDQVRMIGQFWQGKGQDFITWEIGQNGAEGQGHWDEWAVANNWFSKGNAKLVKVALNKPGFQCPTFIPQLDSLTIIADLEKVFLEATRSLIAPIGKDGKELPPAGPATPQ